MKVCNIDSKLKLNIATTIFIFVIFAIEHSVPLPSYNLAVATNLEEGEAKVIQVLCIAMFI